MKSTSLLLGGLLLAAPVAALTAAPADDYEQAVQAFVDAAGEEIRALRTQADALTRDAAPAVRERYAEAYRLIAECEKRHAALKQATARNFDRLKADYEAGREAAKRALAAAIGG